MSALKDRISIFEINKVSIIQLWISNEKVIEVLKKYNIENDVFIKDYAFGIFDYYINIVKGIEKVGGCPVINNLIEFLHSKNLQSSELFVICMGFRDALNDFTYEKNINSKELIKELNNILEENFQAVLVAYSKSYFDMLNKLNLSDDIIDKNVIMSSTDLNGIIIDVSQAFADISGYSKQELVGKPHNIIRHPDMPKELFKELWETIQAGQTWKGVFKNKTKDGGFYWVFATISPNYDSKNNIIGYSAVRQDITAKKEVEAQQSIIIEQSKSVVLGEMITMLAHQWRQPLQATAMLLQQLTLEKMLDGKVKDETLDKVVDSAHKQLEYMSKIIDEFRDFLKPDRSKEKILIDNVIEKARELIAYTLKVDGIELTIDIKDSIIVNIHVNEMVQVLLNIMRNSKDAFVEQHNQIVDKHIAIRSYQDGDNIVIEIEDNAGGISPVIIKSVFDAYFSTKKNKNGTGLGLYMSKNIVENHEKGLLSVKNGKNGAIFRIILPIK